VKVQNKKEQQNNSLYKVIERQLGQLAGRLASALSSLEVLFYLSLDSWANFLDVMEEEKLQEQTRGKGRRYDQQMYPIS